MLLSVKWTIATFDMRKGQMLEADTLASKHPATASIPKSWSEIGQKENVETIHHRLHYIFHMLGVWQALHIFKFPLQQVTLPVFAVIFGITSSWVSLLMTT